jgi:hypothetical protein
MTHAPQNELVHVTATVGDTPFDFEMRAEDFFDTMHRFLGDMVKAKFCKHTQTWVDVTRKNDDLMKRLKKDT